MPQSSQGIPWIEVNHCICYFICIYKAFCFYLHVSIHPITCIYPPFIYLLISHSPNHELYIHPFIYPSIQPSVHPCSHLSILIHVCTCIYSPNHLSVIYPSICSSSVYPYTYSFIQPSVYSSNHLSIHLFIHYASIYLSML